MPWNHAVMFFFLHAVNLNNLRTQRKKYENYFRKINSQETNLALWNWTQVLNTGSTFWFMATVEQIWNPHFAACLSRQRRGGWCLGWAVRTTNTFPVCSGTTRDIWETSGPNRNYGGRRNSHRSFTNYCFISVLQKDSSIK